MQHQCRPVEGEEGTQQEKDFLVALCFHCSQLIPAGYCRPPDTGHQRLSTWLQLVQALLPQSGRAVRQCLVLYGWTFPLELPLDLISCLTVAPPWYLKYHVKGQKATP